MFLTKSKFEEQVNLRASCANRKSHWEGKLASEQDNISAAEKDLEDRKNDLEVIILFLNIIFHVNSPKFIKIYNII